MNRNFLNYIFVLVLIVLAGIFTDYEIGRITSSVDKVSTSINSLNEGLVPELKKLEKLENVDVMVNLLGK